LNKFVKECLFTLAYLPWSCSDLRSVIVFAEKLLRQNMVLDPAGLDAFCALLVGLALAALSGRKHFIIRHPGCQRDESRIVPPSPFGRAMTYLTQQAREALSLWESNNIDLPSMLFLLEEVG
jgi:hypothetical protein